MKDEKSFDNCAYFWFDPWRYSNYCHTCHEGKPTRCKSSSDDYTNGYYRIYSKGNSDDDNQQPEKAYSGDDAPIIRPEPEDRGGKEEARKAKGKNEKKDRQAAERPEPVARPAKQKHVHEFAGSTKLADYEEDVHNHRVAGITGEAVYIPGGHAHKIWTRTDFFDHFHYIQELTGPAIYLNQRDGDGQADLSEQPHVHFITGLTTINDGHSHEYQFATLMDAPLLPEEQQA